ncbi:MAG: L-dopachrome tautomerase-related protein [Desulfuromonadia bacterium]
MFPIRLCIFVLLPILGGCAALSGGSPRVAVELLLTSTRPVTAVAVTPSGRLFVAGESDGTDQPLLQERRGDGATIPFPDGEWNRSRNITGMAPVEHFTAITSLDVDPAGFLWVLDDGRGEDGEREPGGAKLVRIDLRSNRAAQVIPVPERLISPRSHFTDLQVDMTQGVAYLADEGAGAIVAVDLAAGDGWIALDRHPSLTAERLMIAAGGGVLRTADGSILSGNVVTLALSADGEYLLYQSLSGVTLYRIRTALLGKGVDRRDRESGVEIVGRTVVSSRIRTASDGSLLFAAIQPEGVVRLTDDRRLKTLIHDPTIGFSTSLAISGGGSILLATTIPSCIGGGDGCHRLYRITLPGE